MRKAWPWIVLITGSVLLVIGLSSSYLWFSAPKVDVGIKGVNVYSNSKPPYKTIIFSSLFDRALSFRGYGKLLGDKVALVEFSQPMDMAISATEYRNSILSLLSGKGTLVVQDFVGEMFIPSNTRFVWVSPTSLATPSMAVVGKADFDGTKAVGRQMEKSGIPVIWVNATHVTMPYTDGICRAVLENSDTCVVFSSLFLKIVLSMLGFVFLMWGVYILWGKRLTYKGDIPSVNVWFLLLMPLSGFIVPFLVNLYHFPILGLEELLPLSAFMALAGYIAGGRYKFTNFGVGLIFALLIYVVFMPFMYYIGIIPYITLNKVAAIPVIALLVSPYTVAIERWRYHLSDTMFSTLWLPFLYVLMWVPFLLSAFFYTKLPFYHIFFYSYKFLWISLFVGFVSLPFFRKHPEYTGLTTAYLWSIYMVLMLVEVV